MGCLAPDELPAHRQQLPTDRNKVERNEEKRKKTHLKIESKLLFASSSATINHLSGVKASENRK